MLRPIAICLAALLLVAAFSVHADERAEFVQVICVPELDMVEIRPVTVNGGTAVAAARRWPDALKRRHGLYALRPLLTERDGKVLAIRARRIDCRLSRGRVRVTVAPLPGNTDLAGPCGGALSIELSIDEGNRMLVDRLPFERRCDQPYRLARLVYMPGQGYLTVEGVLPAATGEPSSAVTRTNPSDGPGRITFHTEHPAYRVVQRTSVGF
ncbi:MAG: hypothetical protein FJX35_05055 [Alphaproteobacteria bacterium]|nr:hypothetical protein [Alphaproteobacteria bacterium]